MKTKIKIGIGVLAAVLCFGAGFQVGRMVSEKKEGKITSTAISQSLNDCSDLTTAYLNYRGIIKYSQGDIPWINKKSFSMVYDAQLKAGTDLSKVKVQVSGAKITIKIPAVELQSVDVDTRSLEFYDEHLALFNWTHKEDTAVAVNKAKEDAQEKADVEELKQTAGKQAQKAVSKIIKPLLHEKEELHIEIEK